MTPALAASEPLSATEPDGALFQYETLADGTLCLTGYAGNAAELDIPAEIDGCAVTAIGDSCFAGSITLQKVRVPEGVTSIGDFAFECCSFLRKAYLPNSLATIGEAAFSGCVELTMVDMQDQVESIGKGAFLFCRSLVSVDLSPALREMGDFAFAWCTSLASAVFRGSSLAVLPDRAFYHCERLGRITLPTELCAVGKRAFSGCVRLEGLYLPESVGQVGAYAFEGCRAMSYVNFPASKVEEGTFSGCFALNWLNLPDTLQAIGARAFAGSSITELRIPAAVADIAPGAFCDTGISSLDLEGNAAYKLEDGSLYTADGSTLVAYFPGTAQLEGATSFAVPEGVTRIGAYAFYAARLDEVILPSTLQSIGDYAFSHSQLTKLDVPESVRMSESAIESCYGLGWASSQPAPEEQGQAGEAVAIDCSQLPTLEEVLAADTDHASYRYVGKDGFDEWAQGYLAFNRENASLDADHNVYISLYKGEVIPHYLGITSVQNHDPDMTAQAKSAFGDDYEAMYLEMVHGMTTEINRFRMADDLILFSGVYDSQLMAAAGTDAKPSLDQLAACVGNEFTDPIAISTTTDPGIATGFSDTMFIIYASAESVNRLGAVCMDSYMGTNEAEILMNGGAVYRILAVGTMQMSIGDGEGGERIFPENYLVVELLN